ncbi:hypothetical protein FPV67DRAFT_414472 [Lyophyllum atratum]|nr:hypothetical protein FPV67DRAFT_414472 [Lyophyllum atratum]
MVFRGPEPYAAPAAPRRNIPATSNAKRESDRLSSPANSSEHLVMFATPTAVFAWPRLLPASQMGRGPPTLIRYDNTYPVPPSRDDPVDARSVARQPGNSPIMHGLQAVAGHSQSISRHLYETDLSHAPGPLNAIQYWSGVQTPLKNDSHVLRSPYEQAIVTSLHAHTKFSSNSMRSFESIPSPARIPETNHASHRTSTQFRTPPITNSNAWEKYSKRDQSKGGQATYVCLWGVKHGKHEIPCKYTAKKQLVKRHIQTTHLKYKPYMCATCNRRFPQKADLEIHISSHTGLLPHACKYECGQAFKDPARRHRHHVDTHGYIPKTYKKRYKAPMDFSDDDVEDSEDEEEDGPLLLDASHS